MHFEHFEIIFRGSQSVFESFWLGLAEATRRRRRPRRQRVTDALPTTQPAESIRIQYILLALIIAACTVAKAALVHPSLLLSIYQHRREQTVSTNVDNHGHPTLICIAAPVYKQLLP